MGTIWIKDFSGGLDARRLPETLVGNVLMRATNCHATSGGEFEKRRKITAAYTLPAGTKGLAATRDGLVVFGHAATPVGMPSGVTYQRLIDPVNNLALSRILSVTTNVRKLFTIAEYVDDARYMFYDGAVVTDVFDGKARGQLSVVSGTHASSTLTDLKVNGVSIIGATVTYTASNENTASLIAGAINAHTSTPNYSATADGEKVNIVAATAGSEPNDYVISYTVGSSLVLDPTTGTGVMSSGSDGVIETPTHARTVGSKVYTTAGSLLGFSGIRQPTKFRTDAVGAGFIDMGSQDEDAQELKAIHNYQNYIAIFAEDVVLIWYVDPDPNLNRKVQILSNVGTPAPKSVFPFGDNDLLLYHSSGVRSLRARDSSNAAITNDIGSPIDALVKATFGALTTVEQEAVTGFTEKFTGRAWLVMKDTAYIFSYFGNAKISAWSKYDLRNDDGTLSVTDVTVFDKKVYLRSGDTIYVYDSTAATGTYDASEAELRLPFVDASKPTQEKQWAGIDIACEGRWEISFNTNPATPDEYVVAAVVDSTTYGSRRIPVNARSTHISFRFRTTGTTAARLGAAVIHFALDKDED